MTYLLFKFLHVVFAMVWVGGLVLLAVFGLLLLRTSDRQVVASVARFSGMAGGRIIGPAAFLTFLTGFGAMGVGRIGFPFWILWGIATIVIAMIAGPLMFRRTGMALGRLLGQADADERAVKAAQRRLAAQQLALVILLLTAVWAMVFKPTL